MPASGAAVVVGAAGVAADFSVTLRNVTASAGVGSAAGLGLNAWTGDFSSSR